MIKACIFDLDGVIVDTARYHFLAWKELAGELDFELTEQHNEKLKGVSRMRSLEIILELAGLSLSDAEKEKLAERKNSIFVSYIRRITPAEVFPGVRALVRQLREMGIKCAMASSSKNAKTVLRLLQLEDAFDAVVDGTMISHTKPHPEIFLLAASQLGVNPADCLVFEDAEAGVEAALAVGMKCVGVGSPDILKRADKVIARTGDFDLRLLQEL